MAERLDLQALVSDYFSAAGAAVAPLSYALIEVLLPDRLAGLLDVQPHLLLAFDTEVAQETPGSEFITYGHPLLERVLQGCLRMGRTERLYATTTRVAPPGNLKQRLAGDLRFVGGRGVQLLQVDMEEQHAAWFQFRLTLQADEKRHQTAGVLVDLHTALPLDHLVPVLDRTFWDRQSGAVLPCPVTVPLVLAYRTAVTHLGSHAMEEALAEFERQLRPYRDRELKRVQGYYDGLAADLRRRLELAAEAEKRTKLEQKLTATEDDRQRRTKDLLQKYRPRVAAALEAVTWYIWPRIRARLLVEKRDRQEHVDVWYDLIANCAQPLPCTHCRQWLYRMDLTADGPRCPDGCSQAAVAATQG